MTKFRRVLIANRGEIAARIVRTLKRLGLTSIVVYSDADRASLAVETADETFHLGSANALDSYLNHEKVIEAARRTRAEAIHPGYGFLSESSAFARRVIEEGFVWIGPSPEAMDQVASKSQAKNLAAKSGVPVTPGFHGRQDSKTLFTEATKIGFPLLIKAAAGGGGRGIRRVNNAEELESAIEVAKSEAFNSFGDNELILEKYVEAAHHIEVQIFGDAYGNVVHMGERDCSVQRRNQKVIEEAPSSVLSPELRNKLTDAAVRLAKACKYTNAGTVEFLVTPQRDFYFLEVNTRLQVEHPVTEFVTGLDLIEWQLRIANGDPLPRRQESIEFTGHSIQARLYAEDPNENFRPQTGRIEAFQFKERVRTDHFLVSGSSVSPNYDAMLAKIIVHEASRDQAIAAMKQALAETLIVPLKTNLELLFQIVGDDRFAQGRYFTRTLDDAPPALSTSTSLWAAAQAGFEFYLRSRSRIEPHLLGWSNASRISRVSITDETRTFDCVFQEPADPHDPNSSIICSVDGELHPIKIIGDRRFAIRAPDAVSVNDHGKIHQFKSVLSRRMKQAVSNSNEIRSPIDGVVIRIGVSKGSHVDMNQTLAIVEAMKVQMELKSPRAGVVASVDVTSGAQVKNRQLLLKLEP